MGKIIVRNSAEHALIHLTSKDNQGIFHVPDLIFLSINLPKMNAWEFIDTYKQLKHLKNGKTTLIILTASEDPDDRKKALSINEIDDYLIKPLTVERLDHVLCKHFDT